MKATLGGWMALRFARGACWIGFLVYAFATTLDRPAYVNKFGQPLHTTEALLFALMFAVAMVGLLDELMMREKAGIQRPGFFTLMPLQPRTE